VSNDEKVAL